MINGPGGRGTSRYLTKLIINLVHHVYITYTCKITHVIFSLVGVMRCKHDTCNDELFPSILELVQTD